MSAYPNLTGGTTRIAVLNEALVAPVRIKRFVGGAEQRFRVAAGYKTFEIQHKNLTWADVITLRARQAFCVNGLRVF